MAPWCIHISCLERVARSGSGRDSVRGLVGAMDAELSRPDWLATVQSGRKQVQSRVCTPSLRASIGDRTIDGSTPTAGDFEFGTLAIPLTLLCQCLSDETLKAVGPFHLVSMPGEVKDPTSPHWNV